MCGRYTLFTDEEYQDIRKIIRAVQEKGHEVKTGEIYPTNPAPILVWEGKETVPQAVKWGWPKFGTQKSNNLRSLYFCFISLVLSCFLGFYGNGRSKRKNRKMGLVLCLKP